MMTFRPELFGPGKNCSKGKPLLVKAAIWVYENSASVIRGGSRRRFDVRN